MQIAVQKISCGAECQTCRGQTTESASASIKRDVVEQAVGLAFRVSPRELRAPTRRRARVAFARQVAMYMAHIACGLSMTEVGALFGRDRTTVAYACGIVEDRRDDTEFDCFLDDLEAAIARFSKASINLNMFSKP